MELLEPVGVSPMTALADRVPAPLARLADLAFNLRWTWHPETVSLFRQLDAALWASTNHNPVLLLRTISGERLEAVASDPAFLDELDRVATDLDRYLAAADTWFGRQYGDDGGAPVAYFSMEFGLAESLPIYSGGLGVLAGDHLKSASDLGVPFVAVGLFYRHGYFDQTLDPSGWQRDGDEENDPARLPLIPVQLSNDQRLTVEIPLPGRTVTAQVWRLQVGRVQLYLLDADLPTNRAEDRKISDRLYGGDGDLRIRQEIVLGIGGYRALQALGLTPRVFHMNEGHAAFLALEHLRQLMQGGKRSLQEALTTAAPALVFTTHTPVEAGHDYFSPDLMERYFGQYLAEMGLTLDDLLALGRQAPGYGREDFCMTVLALRAAARTNGVSRLHATISRRMWRGVWPDVAEADVPIGYVTNAVHLPTWLAPDVAELYRRSMGPELGRGLTAGEVAARVDQIPAAELWRLHRGQRAALLDVVRQRAAAQAGRGGEGAAGAEPDLDSEVLTIGFARRFATYKRAALLLRDADRLARIIGAAGRPVQFLFAGKAHPRDEGGKALIQRVFELSRQEPFKGRLIFLEDYDMAIARALVQGVDVWLNTPQRPYEASGTSGMKAAANGVLNLSTLDGWWAEAWDEVGGLPDAPGWAIGGGREFDNPEEQAAHDAAALYDLLEREVVPDFYERDESGIPQRWVRRMKASIGRLGPVFSTDRMVGEYTERFYFPPARAADAPRGDGPMG